MKWDFLLTNDRLKGILLKCNFLKMDYSCTKIQFNIFFFIDI